MAPAPVANMPPPPPGNAPPAVVIVAKGPAFISTPILMRCPLCQVDVLTHVKLVPGCFALLMCLLMFLIFFWASFFCLCLIPLCCECCLDAEHRCPRCGMLVARYKRC
uniref:LITAF domain-containing protein n=1 Tax=Panagrolaimus sp. JU765 TaxID=591449 RepID=A0AC34RM74_9BILA